MAGTLWVTLFLLPVPGSDGLAREQETDNKIVHKITDRKLFSQNSAALTNGHPVRGAHGALAAPLECHSEPKRHLTGNLGEERAEIPLQAQQRECVLWFAMSARCVIIT
jgi:hypothetical protein